MKLHYKLLLFIFNWNLISCNFEKKEIKEMMLNDIDVTISQSILKESNLVFDSTLQTSFFNSYPLLATIKQDWQQFYRTRKFSFAWIDTGGITNTALVLHNRINNLKDDGLNDSLLYRSAFNQIFDDASSLTNKDVKDSILINAEMMFTAQYLLYAKQIYKALGKDVLKKMGWNIVPQQIAYTEFLNNALESKTDVFQNEPVYYQYPLLRNYLRQYKDIQSKGGLPIIDTTIKNILPNQQHNGLLAIKKYLQLVGDLKNNDGTTLFDETAVVSIRQFRIRHGLRDTALIDKYVVKEMSVTIQKRMEQILVNMERCKWMPNTPSKNHITVNIPDYTLTVYENNQIQFSMSVVVGTLATKTVIFCDTLKTIAFSPYWYVPYSIFKKELSGKSSRSLRARNMEYYGPNQIRQLPGGNNALGKVKFLFPNHYNIYFHDTPAKDKFNYTQRAFSHGCIRLKEPKKLAEYLLRNEPAYTTNIIDSLMNQKKETQVKLKEPVAVFIGYFTSFVNPDNGLLQFRKDIYNYDEKVLINVVNR